jgi:phosphoribosylformimino-5-aminoimidazole carboxamide ribotide isomerase
MQVIPAIDLLGGQCVRLYRGDFAQVTVYPQAPLDLARAYRDAGLERLHVVDLDGARSGTAGNRGLLEQLSRLPGLAVQVGGGVRDPDRARALLTAGAARVVVGSVAAEQPERVHGWIDALGPDRLVLALDVRMTPGADPEVLTRGWVQGAGRSLWSLVESLAAPRHVEVLCTDIGQDGTLAGPNLALYAEFCRRFPEVPLIASGGVGGIGDLRALASTGAGSVVTGRALLDGRLTLEELQPFSRVA